jgi:RNA polymerase sigma-70 factor (ECF subfamily)
MWSLEGPHAEMACGVKGTNATHESSRNEHHMETARLDAPSDHVLLSEFRSGNQDAASELYRRYAPRLRALAKVGHATDLASRLDCDDIVQSVFKSFFRGVRRGAYDIPAGEELWHLFLAITLNKIRAKGVHHRAAKRDVRLTVRSRAIEKYPDPRHSDEQAMLLLKMGVEETLSQLPERHRLVAELRMEDRGIAEIAGRLGCSRRSIERILHDCRVRLASFLAQP